MKTDYLKMIQELDEGIRKGQIEEVRKRCRSIQLSSVPQPESHLLAKIFRRCNLPQLGLLLLKPYLISHGKNVAFNANDDQRVEYSANLLKIGAIKEARSLLATVKKESIKEAHLILAFCDFAEWNYHPSIQHLKYYLESFNNSEYEILVAQLNLSLALIYTEQFNLANQVLEEMLKVVETDEYRFIHRSVLELKAQLLFYSNDYRGSQYYLNKTEELFVGNKTTEDLFIQKWKSLVGFRLGVLKESSLNEVVQTARKFKHWETIRHIDFLTAAYKNDHKALVEIYFKTPLKYYRDQIQKIVGVVPENIFLGESCVDYFDVFLGQISSDISLNPASGVHRFLYSLTKDFYRPVRVGALFSEVFPDEYYNPETASDRIYQLVGRSRKWFAENSLNFEIDSKDSGYQLKFSSPFGLKLYKDLSFPTKDAILMSKFQERFRKKTFSRKQMQDFLDISYGSTNQLISSLSRNQKIQKIGSGPRTKYKFLKAA